MESDLINPIQNVIQRTAIKVTLSHDYGLKKERNVENPTERDEGFTSVASLYYKKKFFVKPSSIDKSFILEFEGIM